MVLHRGTRPSRVISSQRCGWKESFWPFWSRDMHSLPDLATGLPESRDSRESYDSCATRLRFGVGDYHEVSIGT
jgi:hypothetical protein